VYEACTSAFVHNNGDEFYIRLGTRLRGDNPKVVASDPRIWVRDGEEKTPAQIDFMTAAVSAVHVNAPVDTGYQQLPAGSK
jgi:hypothetical protein